MIDQSNYKKGTHAQSKFHSYQLSKYAEKAYKTNSTQQSCSTKVDKQNKRQKDRTWCRKGFTLFLLNISMFSVQFKNGDCFSEEEIMHLHHSGSRLSHKCKSDHSCYLGRVPYGIRRYSMMYVRHGTITHVGKVQHTPKCY